MFSSFVCYMDLAYAELAKWFSSAVITISQAELPAYQIAYFTRWTAFIIPFHELAVTGKRHRLTRLRIAN
jgi:hypothetical protein